MEDEIQLIDYSKDSLSKDQIFCSPSLSGDLETKSSIIMGGLSDNTQLNNALGKWVGHGADVFSNNHLLEFGLVGFEEDHIRLEKPFFPSTLTLWGGPHVNSFTIGCFPHGSLLLSLVLVILTWPLEEIHTLLQVQGLLERNQNLQSCKVVSPRSIIYPLIGKKEGKLDQEEESPWWSVRILG